jgi:hypothetical protein
MIENDQWLKNVEPDNPVFSNVRFYHYLGRKASVYSKVTFPSLSIFYSGNVRNMLTCPNSKNGLRDVWST